MLSVLIYLRPQRTRRASIPHAPDVEQVLDDLMFEPPAASRVVEELQCARRLLRVEGGGLAVPEGFAQPVADLVAGGFRVEDGAEGGAVEGAVGLCELVRTGHWSSHFQVGAEAEEAAAVVRDVR